MKIINFSIFSNGYANAYLRGKSRRHLRKQQQQRQNCLCAYKHHINFSLTYIWNATLQMR